MSDKEAQEDELLALASIYDSDVFSTSGEFENGQGEAGGQFAAHLDLPEPFQVKLETFSGSSDDAAEPSNGGQYPVKYLPPIMLYFELPADYPSKQPPRLTLACKWLTLEQMSRLCDRLDEIWEENEGEVILFMWTSFLKDDTLEYLGITSPLDLSRVVDKRTKRPMVENAQGEQSQAESAASGGGGAAVGGAGECVAMAGAAAGADLVQDSRAVQDIATQDLLMPTILEHDKVQQERDYLSTLFTCQVCFMEKLGALCMSFTPCRHVYCKECMRGYFQVQIEDGSVKALTCPNADCESQAHPSQVKELVTGEQFQRYDRLLLQSSLDTMSDIVYCPRLPCGCAVMLDASHSMGSCPACHYVFCIFCKHAYHGISPCKIRSEDIKKIKNEYMAADSKGKTAIEKRYGRRMVQQVIEESFTNDYLQESAKKCPHCRAWIQKMDGCNKMTCTKCRTNFCWLCQSRLPKQNPYLHFNQLGSPCFNQLFHGVTMDEDDEDDEDFLLEDEADTDEELALLQYI